MKATVAIPCYNGAAHVGQTIESALRQSRPADRILVIDDGSTDESSKIIQRYPVELIEHSENRGLAHARNTAIENATGDLIVFIDADALPDSELLATLLSGYQSPDVGGVGGQGIESNIRTLADRWRRVHATQGHGDTPRDVQFLFGLCMSFRLDALRHVGGFDPAFHTNAEDMDIGYRLNTAGYRLRYVPDAKVYHQRTDSEETLKRTIANWYISAYRAKRANHASPWTLFAGTLRRLVTDPLSDLIIEHDYRLAQLSLEINWIKLRALQQVARGV